MMTMSPSRRVTLYIFRPASMSAFVMTVPFSRHGFLHTALSLISAAAALVTAGVTRLVAPVSSFGPHGEGGTIVLQSVWASAAGTDARSAANSTMTTSRDLHLMRRTPFDGEGHGTSGAVTPGW